MAGGRIAGITVEINGDTTKLTKALEGTNKSLKSTQTQLKDVEKLLKLDPTNITLLRQKQELLTKAVEDTRKKLDQLKDAQKQMDASGVDKTSKEYEALQREIIDTEQQLKGLEKAAAQSNAVLAKIGGVAQQISDKTGEWAEKTRALSTAAGGALAALGGLAYKAVTASDDLNTMAKQSGFTTDELQKMQYAADRMDVEVDTIVKSGEKLKKSMVSTSEATVNAFTELGVSVTDSSGNIRNSTEVFWETVEALGNVSDETERDVLAMQIFGKSSAELAGIVDDGGEAFRTMGEEAENLGLILSQDTLNSLNDTNDRIDQIKAQFAATLTELGAKVAEVLLPIFDQVAAGISKVLDWLGSLDAGQLQTIMTILAVVASISPLLEIISKVSAAISTITSVISFLTSPVGLVIAAIAALVAAFVLLWENCEGFREFWVNLWNGIKEITSAVIDWLKNAIQSIKDFFSPAVEAMQDAIGKLKNKIQGEIIPAFKEFSSAIKEKVAPVLQTIKDYVNIYVQPAFELLKTGIANLKTVFQTGFEVIKTVVSTTFENIKTVIKAAWDVIKTIVSTALDVIKGVIKTATAVINGDWKGAWEGIKSIFMSVWNGIKSTLSTVLNAIKSLITNNLNAAKNSVTSIFNGIKTTIQNSINGAKNVVQSGLNAIKGFFSNLKLSFPKIKLPHFKITGKLSLDPPSVPHISIDWYAKAMNNPMLLNGATIFGAMGGKLLGGGEKGQEVVAGASKLMDMIQSALQMTLKNSDSSAGRALNGTIKHSGTIRIEGVNNRGEFVAAGKAVIDDLGMRDIARFVMGEIQAEAERKAAVY